MACAGKARTLHDPGSHTLHERLRKNHPRKDRCERCGNLAGSTRRLDLHHIDGNYKNNDASNLMTFCVRCHTRWHWEHGKQFLRHRRNTSALNLIKELHHA
jgi:hypothetical protein